jgi:hypothetical protein
MNACSPIPEARDAILHQFTVMARDPRVHLQKQMIRFLRRGSTGTSADTSVLLLKSADILIRIHPNPTYRLEVTRGTLLVTGIVSPSVLPVSTSRSLVGTLSSLTTSVSGRSSSRSSGLHVGLGNNLGRNVEVFSEVGETLIGEGVVVPLPRELGLDESLGGEGLHGLDNLEVSDGHVGVLGSVEVLGSNEDTLLEEVLVDLRR